MARAQAVRARVLEHFFAPRAVAVIGASTDPASVGQAVLRNLLSYGYTGEVYPINPKVTELLGKPCYPSVLEVPGSIDLAVVIVPAAVVPVVMEQCGQKGIDAAIIISAGFKETGPEGAKLERQVVQVAQQHGTRIVGPNCLGIMVPATGLNASFGPLMPKAGNLAVMSQSGALGTAMLDWAVQEGVGLSAFVSFGNGADVNFAELLQAMHQDERTGVVIAYMEGVSNGRAFMEASCEITRTKPLIVIKSGTTSAGSRAVSSHTGSLAGAEQAYQAAFRQCGVIRARSVDELFDYALAFSYQPLPETNTLGLVTNAGGPGIMATDAAEQAGLVMAALDKATVEKLRERLPPAANFYNPVDVLGDAGPELYRYGLEQLLADANVGSVIAIVTPQAVTRVAETAQAIAQAAAGAAKPVLACLMGGKLIAQGDQPLREHRIPSYRFPEEAVEALGAMARYRQWREQPSETLRAFKVNRGQAEQAIAAARRDDRLNLGELEAREILRAYGYQVPEGRLARSAQEAVAIADEIGYPVVLKIASPDILHKSDIGGVRINVADAQAVADTYDLITMRAQRYLPEAEIWGCLVQQMVTEGKEVILGMSRDPQFGPLLMFGLGGIYVEVLKDVSFRVAPISERQARQMLGEVRSYPLLAGVRGEKPADTDAIVESLLRLSQLVTDFPEIMEMDINPLKVRGVGQGAVAIDARITIS